MVEPILLYGCAIWGFENLKVLEQVHLMFCKRILKVRSTTPNYMVYGELVSSSYANFMKYHIQGMPTNIILQVCI
jgi:hypothetical protein